VAFAVLVAGVAGALLLVFVFVLVVVVVEAHAPKINEATIKIKSFVGISFSFTD
jgi:hypothetical protein